MGTTRKRFYILITAGIVVIFLYAFYEDILESLNVFLDASSSQDPEGAFPTVKSFKCDNKWAQEYQKYHAQSLNSRDKDRKFLIYHCAGHKGGCGGYGNRMSVIVSVFYLAVLLNRTFMINWGGPELLHTFFTPNKIDWRHDKQKFEGLKTRKTYWGLGRIPGYDRFAMFDASRFDRWTRQTDFHKYFELPVEQIVTIWYFADNLWDNPSVKKRATELGIPFRRRDYPYGMMGCAMRFLFRKSRYLRRELDKAKASLPKTDRPMIGIHLRTSDHHFGSHNDDTFHVRDPKRVFACAQRVENALKRKNMRLRTKSFTWFLAADDKHVKDQALKDYPDKLVTFDLNPLHLDVSKSGFQKILHDLLMDQLMLLECDYFIGSKTSTFTFVVQGTRQFPMRSFVLGEKCDLNENIVALSPPSTT